jgi:hypothetical protein
MPPPSERRAERLELANGQSCPREAGFEYACPNGSRVTQLFQADDAWFALVADRLEPVKRALLAPTPVEAATRGVAAPAAKPGKKKKR